MPIVVMPAVEPEISETEEKHREDIARLKREKKIIGKQKTAVDMV